MGAQATQGVPSVGTLRPKVLFLGEAPGKDEDLGGKPFIGRAGKLLQSIFQSFNITLDDIYVTNVLKHRPPNNRNPLPAEVDACAKHALVQEIALVQPKTIVCLGRQPTLALHRIAGIDLPKGSLRGYTFEYKGIPVLSTWHPAYILRAPGRKSELVEDILQAFEE